MEMRKEDLGKMMLKNAEPVDLNIIQGIVDEYINDTKNSLYLLYSRELSYFTTIKNNSFLSSDSAKNFIEFLEESSYLTYDLNDKSEIVNLNTVPLAEVVEAQLNNDLGVVELWIGKGNPKFFQLMEWDDSTIHI